jgi:hypothetical protein
MHGVRGDPGVARPLCELHREHQHEELSRRVRCKNGELRFTLRVIYVLFGETKKPMRVVHAQTVGDSLAFLTYERVRDAYSILQADSRRRWRNRHELRPTRGDACPSVHNSCHAAQHQKMTERVPGNKVAWARNEE